MIENNDGYTFPDYGTEDCALCDKTFAEIIDKYSDEVIATDFSKEELVVVSVWTVTGTVENGGFRYLFASKIPGDPGYRLAFESFEKIESLEALEALKKAFGLFPDAEIPTNNKERIRLYESAPKKLRDEIDAKFFDAHNDTIKLLAGYIRKNF